MSAGAAAMRQRWPAALVMGAALFQAPPAWAEVKEYQIRRMLLLKTECRVTGLESAQTGGGRERFSATCENVSHYPDGVVIDCPETEDERDCRILTAKREFRHLDLLGQ